jgi:hypothetical protein
MTNFDVGIDYLKPALPSSAFMQPEVPYWHWPPSMDFVPDGVGAYAINKPAPGIQDVINGGVVTVEGVDQGLGFQKGIFCAAVVNLIRRANRKIVPTMGNPLYDGGTWACQNFWHLYMTPFNIYSAYPPGTLIGKYFEWWGDPGASAVKDQGHVVVLWDEHNLAMNKDAWVVQSHPEVGGLNWWTRLTASHEGGYYDYAIRPENWIDHDQGGF